LFALQRHLASLIRAIIAEYASHTGMVLSAGAGQVFGAKPVIAHFGTRISVFNGGFDHTGLL